MTDAIGVDRAYETVGAVLSIDPRRASVSRRRVCAGSLTVGESAWVPATSADPRAETSGGCGAFRTTRPSSRQLTTARHRSSPGACVDIDDVPGADWRASSASILRAATRTASAADVAAAAHRPRTRGRQRVPRIAAITNERRGSTTVTETVCSPSAERERLKIQVTAVAARWRIALPSTSQLMFELVVVGMRRLDPYDVVLADSSVLVGVAAAMSSTAARCAGSCARG